MEFVELISTPSNIDSLSENQVEELIERYPWFYLGKLVALRHSKNSPEKYRQQKKPHQNKTKYQPHSDKKRKSAAWIFQIGKKSFTRYQNEKSDYGACGDHQGKHRCF
jgi:hypothetical protein